MLSLEFTVALADTRVQDEGARERRQVRQDFPCRPEHTMHGFQAEECWDALCTVTGSAAYVQRRNGEGKDGGRESHWAPFATVLQGRAE